MPDVSRDVTAGSCTIVDSPKVFVLLLGSVGFLVGACWLFFAGLSSENMGAFLCWGGYSSCRQLDILQEIRGK